MHSVPAGCRGENCSVCGKPATHKVEEVIFCDGPIVFRHPLTAYICCAHFVMLMGPAAERMCEVSSPAPAPKKQRYLRVNVSPGMFKSERCVTFKIHDISYCSLVDERSVYNDGHKDLLEIHLLQDMGEGKVLIQLPRETFTTSTHIVVPWDYIV